MEIMNKQGFTLIELLIVIGIIGILAMVATTSYIGSMLKADRSEAYTNLESLRLLEEQLFAENACYQPLVAGVCPAGGTISYNATPGTADSGIEDALPGFQPSGCTGCATPFGLKYTYVITQNVQITGGGNSLAVPPTTGAQDPCFVATATGVAGTRVCKDPPNDCDVFAIDCNNNKNF